MGSRDARTNYTHMIPTHAKFKDEEDCQNTSLSHLEVFGWLKKFVDVPAMVAASRASAAGSSDAGSSTRPPVKFLLILDMCRDLFGTSAPSVSDPLPDAAPDFWSMCLSTSCGSVAVDGVTHSPFTEDLLDATHGIGASNMPLKKGIEWVCSGMDAKRGQEPVTTNLHRIPSAFSLNEPRSSPDAGSPGVGSAGASVIDE
jgi:hypothetical protein